MGLRHFSRSDHGGTGAEFALLLPLIILFLFGIIDAGRYAWEFNKAEKATQRGARWAIVTDLVPSDLASYSFAVSGGIPQGTVVPRTNFNGISCQSSGSAVTCACPSGAPCAFGTTADADAFADIVTRMQTVKRDIAAENVVVDYLWSGLGFAGDPNGPDVSPLVNVRLRDMTYRPITCVLFDCSVALPDASYSLTLEDGVGSESDG